MYEGIALKKQVVPTLSERLTQAVIRSIDDLNRGYADARRTAAGVCRQYGVVAYLEEPDDDLLEHVANAADAGAPGFTSSYLRGYRNGLAEFRADLEDREDDAAALQRLQAEGALP